MKMKTYTRKNSSYLKKVFSASNFDEICRLCLSEVNNLLPLFGEEETYYTERIKFALDILVHEGDRMPSNICENCHMLIEQTYLFKKKCFSSEEKLREHFRILDVEEEQKINYSLSMNTLEEAVMQEIIPSVVDLPSSQSEHAAGSIDMNQTENSAEEDKPPDSGVQLEELCPADKMKVEAIEEVCTVNTETETRRSMSRLSQEICQLWERETDEEDEGEEETIGDERVVLLDISKSSASQVDEDDIMEVEVEVQDNHYVVKEVTKLTSAKNLMTASHIYDPLSCPGKRCHICNKMFTSKNSVDRHMLVHSGERPYHCSVCGRDFNQLTILKRHMFLHQVEKPFQCDLCNKSYTQRENLKMHMAVHGFKETKPMYQCKQCDKQFLHASGLSRHLSFHKGKRFACHICSNSYSDSSTLSRHLKSRHANLCKPGLDNPVQIRNLSHRVESMKKVIHINFES